MGLPFTVQGACLLTARGNSSRFSSFLGLEGFKDLEGFEGLEGSMGFEGLEDLRDFDGLKSSRGFEELELAFWVHLEGLVGKGAVMASL